MVAVFAFAVAIDRRGEIVCPGAVFEAAEESEGRVVADEAFLIRNVLGHWKAEALVVCFRGTNVVSFDPSGQGEAQVAAEIVDCLEVCLVRLDSQGEIAVRPRQNALEIRDLMPGLGQIILDSMKTFLELRSL